MYGSFYGPPAHNAQFVLIPFVTNLLSMSLCQLLTLVDLKTCLQWLYRSVRKVKFRVVRRVHNFSIWSCKSGIPCLIQFAASSSWPLCSRVLCGGVVSMKYIAYHQFSQHQCPPQSKLIIFYKGVKRIIYFRVHLPFSRQSHILKALGL